MGRGENSDPPTLLRPYAKSQEPMDMGIFPSGSSINEGTPASSNVFKLSNVSS
eukprot:TRINITY_DN3971_c0_g1_i1.p4 TRINITY_DN3971_c0_g1~~TRINITY_DN3971_c0_g1_i1.p4  ORF type:complete len:53 (-),score=6.14 TRINITY_DN3971_c0_g1_i1:147-305(-)